MPGVALSIVTLDWVKKETRGKLLWCAKHKEWHVADQFSPPQRKSADSTRYCLQTTQSERAVFEADVGAAGHSVVPSREAKIKVLQRMRRAWQGMPTTVGVHEVPTNLGKRKAPAPSRLAAFA